MEDVKPIPVLLICGFLGSGKSTLLNYILTEKHGLRCAVILNEFGDSAAIETSILRSSIENDNFSSGDWIELANGCACCSVKNDFLRAIENLVSGSQTYDYIFIEATGLALPGPIAAALWTDKALECKVCLDAVVTIVDARNFANYSNDEGLKRSINEKQIAYADIVICNKIDLVDDIRLKSILQQIQNVNNSCEIYSTINCKVKLSKLLNKSLYNMEPNSKYVDSFYSKNIGQKLVNYMENSWSNDLSIIKTVHIQLTGSLDLECFKQWVDELLWEQENKSWKIMRMKGLINITGLSCKCSIQGVDEIYDIQELPATKLKWNDRNDIVIIGTGLNKELFLHNLQGCINCERK